MATPREETDHDFSSTNAEASFTNPTQASQLAKGDFILIKNHPCKIISKSTSKPGKHGHAKINFEALCLFTAKKYTDLHPAHATVEAPIVVRREYLLLDIEGGYLSLWDQTAGGALKDDVRMPKTDESGTRMAEMGELLGRVWGKEGEKDIMVTVLSAMGMEVVDGVKEFERG
ncbi:MAG: hypothetical protein Q9197_006822 [Variospora fuerteventurae]